MILTDPALKLCVVNVWGEDGFDDSFLEKLQFKRLPRKGGLAVPQLVFDELDTLIRSIFTSGSARSCDKRSSSKWM